MDRLTIRNAFSAPDSGREHRLLFDAGGGTPEANPPPPPRAENLPDFNRLHQGAEANGNTAERTNKEVYDKMSGRQTAYRAEVAALTQYIQKVGGTLESNTKSTRDRANQLIDDLQSVYRRTYESNGTTQEYRNGLYARVNDIEARYVTIENSIATIEKQVSDNNGGRMPPEITPYQDRVRAQRTRDALENGNGSVDIRTYTTPFAPETMSQTSTYSLLRVPANFEFEWSGNPEVARIMAGNYDMQNGGLSNGIQYLRIKTPQATELARQNLSVRVAVRGVNGAIQGYTTATFNTEGPINENPNGNNTLVRITYSRPLTSPDGTPIDGPIGEGDIPVLDEKVQAENREKSRKEFHEAWEKKNAASLEAKRAYEAVPEENTTERIRLLELYIKVLGEESDHLEQDQTALAWPDGDVRTVSHANRRAELPGELKTSNETIADLRDYADFAQTATRLQSDTETALSNIPAALPGEDDVDGWAARIELINLALSRLTVESEHLGDFTGRGATEGQRTIIAARLRAVEDTTKTQTEALSQAREGRDTAEKNKFHADWLLAKENSDNNEEFYQDAIDSEEQVSVRLQNIGDYIESLQRENEHLDSCNREIYDPSDERLTTYNERSEEIDGLLTTLNIKKEQMEAYQTFDETAKENRRLTDDADREVAVVNPENDDIEGWQSQVEGLEGYGKALEVELAHLRTFMDSAAFEGATPTERTAVSDRISAIETEQKTSAEELDDARESLAEAERIVYFREWGVKFDATEASITAFEGVDAEDIEERVTKMETLKNDAVDEYEHLTGDNIPEFKAEDPRSQVLNERLAYLQNDATYSVDAITVRLEQLTAARDFIRNADVYEGESDAAYNAIPNTDPANNDPDGWDNMIKLTTEYVNRLEGEKGHLDTFDGSVAEQGTTPTQAGDIRTRRTNVTNEIDDMNNTELPRLLRLRNEAECNKFEEDWDALKLSSDAAEQGWDQAKANGASAEIRLSELNDYVLALQNEQTHLGTLNAEIHDPADARLATYYARINSLNEDIPDLQTHVTEIEDYIEFRDAAYLNADVSDGLFDNIPDAPVGRGQVDGWRNRKQAIDTYVEALQYESKFLESGVGRPALTGALQNEIDEMVNRYFYVGNEITLGQQESTAATEAMHIAMNDKFEDDWNALKQNSDNAEIPWNGALVTDGMPASLKLGTLSTYRQALQAELGHLNGAPSLPADPSAAARPGYNARTGVVMNTLADLVTKEAELTALDEFEQQQTKLKTQTEASKGTSEAAVAAAAPEAEDLPSWTRRRDAVQRYVADLTAEQTHLQSLGGSPANNVITAGDRGDVEQRLKDIESALKTQEAVLKTQQDGVDAARVDNVTTIDTDLRGPVRLRNRTETQTRTINRFQDIRITKGVSLMTIPAGTNGENPEFPLITRNPATHEVTIRAGERASGTYNITVGGHTSTITITGVPPRRP